MKNTFLICFVIISGSLFGQEKSLALKSFVKNDTIQLRWAPSNADLFIQGLEYGYTIRRMENSSNKTTEIKIAPFAERKVELLKSKDSTTLFLADFLSEYIAGGFTENAQRTVPFFGISLAAGADRKIAEICGLYFEEVIINKYNYQYEIWINGREKDINLITVDANVNDKNPPCSELTGESRIDLKESYLKWEAKSQIVDYSGYWIMKSTDNVHFEKLNEIPQYFLTSQYEPDKTHLDFVDTAVVEGQTYWYYIQPINHFADYGEKSNTVKVYIQRRLNGVCIIDTIYRQDYDRIIKGEYRSEFEEDEIESYILYRSKKVDSGFVQIDQIKSSQKQYEFTYRSDLKSGDRQYFKVAAISVDGDTAFSFAAYHFSYDQEPPEMPTALKGEITDSGLVKLYWMPPNDKDIRGYRVYRKNGLEDEMVEVTRKLAPAPNYVDTIRLDNLTSEIYYLVRSVDENHNNSPLTEPVLLMKPDTIPPIASIITRYKVETNGIYLAWENSPSSDLFEQGLIRANLNTTDTILRFTTNYTELKDSTVALGVEYEYSIYTLDKAANKSSSDSISITYETGYRSSVYSLTGETDRLEKTITLNWQLPQNGEIYSIQIFRAKGEGNFRSYKTLREPETSFVDSNLSPNNVYRYKVKVIYKSGHSSVMSDFVEVVY